MRVDLGGIAIVKVLWGNFGEIKINAYFFIPDMLR